MYTLYHKIDISNISLYFLTSHIYGCTVLSVKWVILTKLSLYIYNDFMSTVIISDTFDGVKESFGIKKIHKINWDGVCYDLPRSGINSLKGVQYSEKPAVYHLLDTETEEVYIGQTDNLRSRISAHNTNTDFLWTRIVAFTSASDIINASHMKYLEYKLTEDAKEIGKIEIYSGGSKVNNIGKEFEFTMDEYRENLKSIMPLIGLNFYTPIDKDQTNVFYCEDRYGSKGEGVLKGDGFLLKKGSVLKKEIHTGSSGFAFHQKERKIYRQWQNY